MHFNVCPFMPAWPVVDDRLQEADHHGGSCDLLEHCVIDSEEGKRRIFVVLVLVFTR